MEFIGLFTTKGTTTSNNLNSFHHVNKISFQRNDWNDPIYKQSLNLYHLYPIIVGTGI